MSRKTRTYKPLLRRRHTTVVVTPRKRSCTGGRSRPASTWSSASPRPTWSGLIGELGADLEPLGSAAVPDRRALRPVRGARARALVLRHLRRRAVDPGRHAVGGDTGRRGRRAPVNQDAVDRPGAARLRQLRARVRHRRRVDPARRASADSAGPTAAHPICGSRPGRWTRRSPRCPPTRPPGSAAAARWSQAHIRCGASRTRRSRWSAMGAMVTEMLAAAERLADARRGRRRRLRHQPRTCCSRRSRRRRGTGEGPPGSSSRSSRPTAPHRW